MRELVNPDDATMVLLYHDLAGLAPPIDAWVEDDLQVRIAPAIDKAARRDTVRAALQATFAAVHDVGRLRLSVSDAGLSDYDPAYGEFSVRALSPSSELGFQAFGQKVVTRFVNGPAAQLWKVPPDQAQAVRDRVGGRRVGLDLLLDVTGAQPGARGGAILTRIVSYELRTDDGQVLHRGSPADR